MVFVLVQSIKVLILVHGIMDLKLAVFIFGQGKITTQLFHYKFINNMNMTSTLILEDRWQIFL